jgi:hypothetical protein
MEARSKAPWIDDRSSWGRVRLTRSMWAANYTALQMYLQAKWKIHHLMPNPSPESRASLTEIREIQKVITNLEGLGEEKGWELPAIPD